jgi:hypothetical protein
MPPLRHAPAGLILLAITTTLWGVIILLAIALVASASTVGADVAAIVRLLGVAG